MAFLALGGVLYGLTFYTYLAARFTPVALLGFLILWYIAGRPDFPRLPELAAFSLPAILTGLPWPWTPSGSRKSCSAGSARCRS